MYGQKSPNNNMCQKHNSFVIQVFMSQPNYIRTLHAYILKIQLKIANILFWVVILFLVKIRYRYFIKAINLYCTKFDSAEAVEAIYFTG